mgnify:CR=1 FL=1
MYAWIHVYHSLEWFALGLAASGLGMVREWFVLGRGVVVVLLVRVRRAVLACVYGRSSIESMM